jgi:hypothetical protein
VVVAEGIALEINADEETEGDEEPFLDVAQAALRAQQENSCSEGKQVKERGNPEKHPVLAGKRHPGFRFQHKERLLHHVQVGIQTLACMMQHGVPEPDPRAS